MSLSLGIDIGGTSTKAAVLDDSGSIIASTSIPTRHGPQGLITTATTAVASMLAAAEMSIDRVELIGMGVPGAVDPSAGTVRYAVNLGIGAEPVMLADAVSIEFGRPVHVENDVKAAALGAAVVVAATRGPVASLAYVSIGTGIAAGLVENGRLRRGSTLIAGEIGHVPIDPAGPLCACGQRGCIEAVASGSAIERLWPVADGSPARSLASAAAAGDIAAVAAWRQVIGGLSRAVQLLTLTVDPDVIVLSGGVADLGEELRAAIIERLEVDLAHTPFLRSLRLGQRIEVIDPSVLLGPMGAVIAARMP